MNDRPRAPRSDWIRNHALLKDAAWQVFDESGVDASLNEVARRAGVDPASLYRHFATRDDLIRELYVDAVGWLGAILAEIGEPGPGESLAGIRRFLEGAMARMTEHPSCNGVLARMAEIDPAQREGDVLAAPMQRLVERGQADGLVSSDVTATDLALMIPALNAVSIGTDALAERSWRRMLVVLLRGLHPAAAAAGGGEATALSRDELHELMNTPRA